MNRRGAGWWLFLWASHQPQESKVGADCGIDRGVCLVVDLMLVANLRDDSSHLGVVNMANPREEVVDNLEVQSAEVPGEQAVVRIW
jgi:hypothetical protein